MHTSTRLLGASETASSPTPPLPESSTHHEGLQAGEGPIQPDPWSKTSTVLEQRVEESGERGGGKRVTGLGSSHVRE